MWKYLLIVLSPELISPILEYNSKDWRSVYSNVIKDIKSMYKCWNSDCKSLVIGEIWCRNCEFKYSSPVIAGRKIRECLYDMTHNNYSDFVNPVRRNNKKIRTECTISMYTLRLKAYFEKNSIGNFITNHRLYKMFGIRTVPDNNKLRTIVRNNCIDIEFLSPNIFGD